MAIKNTIGTAATIGRYKYKPFTSSDYLSGLGTKRDEYLNAVENYGDFKASEALNLSEQQKKNAENAVANYGDFSYKNQGWIDDILNQRMNREKFSYDLNGDALYQQYKDKYINQGRMAMQDTIGQASAMTGGYGNSYAATAGNQAYQASLQNLNDIVPQLYQMALDQYNQETQDLNDKYSLLSNDRSNEYGMWGDKRNALVADRDYMANDYLNKYNQEYGQYTDKYGRLVDLSSAYENRYTNQYNQEYGQHSDTESYAYKAARDAVADRQFNESQKAGGGNTKTWDVDDYHTVMYEAQGLSGDNDALDKYLNQMVTAKIITEEERDSIYEAYRVDDKSNPTESNPPKTIKDVIEGMFPFIYGFKNNKN